MTSLSKLPLSTKHPVHCITASLSLHLCPPFLRSPHLPRCPPIPFQVCICNTGADALSQPASVSIRWHAAARLGLSAFLLLLRLWEVSLESPVLLQLTSPWSTASFDTLAPAPLPFYQLNPDYLLPTYLTSHTSLESAQPPRVRPLHFLFSAPGSVLHANANDSTCCCLQCAVLICRFYR